MADDNGGADFNAGTDSLHELAIAVAGSGLKLTDVVDAGPPALTVGDALAYAGAMFNGKFDINTPSAGQTTFYERDDTTPLSVVSTAPTGRSRVSP